MKIYLEVSFNKNDEEELEYVTELDKVLKAYSAILNLYEDKFEELKSVFDFAREETDDKITYAIKNKSEDIDNIADLAFSDNISNLVKAVIIS